MAFREGQQQIIDALLEDRDALGVMPTGAGKSICYQIPALMREGITLVISPLISLMKDQVTSLIQSGIPAAFLNSSLTLRQQSVALERARAGRYKLIYVAPERLSTSSFLNFVAETEISMVAVDEAHCVSQWGQDFRPDYLNISDFIERLPNRPPLGAFTATATPRVRRDIKKLLCLRDPEEVTTGFDRPNLFFDVIQPPNREAHLLNFIRERAGESGIVYCSTRKQVEQISDLLVRKGISAGRYHAGLSDEERRKNQDDFDFDNISVMVATNAFGMGIDKSNVSFVVHYSLPKSPEAYYQEAGRAGRDGLPAHCLLMHAPQDIRTAKFLIDHSNDNETLTPEESKALRDRDRKRLYTMIDYTTTTDCLRNYLLRYFGERPKAPCGHCGNCTDTMTTTDITLLAQKILSGIARVNQRHPYGLGVSNIVKMLHGSKDKRILELQLDRLSTYGILRGNSVSSTRQYIDLLLQDQYIVQTKDEYPVLNLTAKALKALKNRSVIKIHHRETTMLPDPAKKSTPSRSLHTYNPANPRSSLETPAEQALYDCLAKHRREIADQLKAPAYTVFPNATLIDMAKKAPTDLAEFRSVSGIGAIKAEKYGSIFLALIRKWKAEQALPDSES